MKISGFVAILVVMCVGRNLLGQPTISQVADLRPGTDSSDPMDFTIVGDEFDSFALMAFLGNAPFVVSPNIGTDILRFYLGEENGLVEIEDFQSDASFPPREFVEFNGSLFFRAKGQSGSELHRLSINPTIAACDLDAGGVCDVGDINLLTTAIQSDGYQAELDLNDDLILDNKDRVFWVEELMNTGFGDANLDLQVDEIDFELFSPSLFTNETDWGQGDFNGDGTTDGSDFNLWNSNRPFVTEGQSAPEPSGLAIAGIAITMLCSIRRSRLIVTAAGGGCHENCPRESSMDAQNELVLFLFLDNDSWPNSTEN